MVRRVVLGVVLGAVAFAGLIGVEVFLAVHRRYQPTEPPLKVGGSFGPAGGHPLTFVVLGDSTAAGVGAGDAAHAYPTLLAERLGRLGWRVHLIDLGISGARTHDVLIEQLPKAEALGPGLVFVGIGANDATHLSGLGVVASDMGMILDRLKRSGATVVVAGAPDMHAPAFLPPLRQISGWRGRHVAAAIAGAARSRHVPVVPLAEETGHLFTADPARYYSPDRFHPGPAGYAAWANAIFPVLERAVGRPPA
jgi:lysophospholipase L1-like esterase